MICGHSPLLVSFPSVSLVLRGQTQIWGKKRDREREPIGLPLLPFNPLRGRYGRAETKGERERDIGSNLEKGFGRQAKERPRKALLSVKQTHKERPGSRMDRRGSQPRQSRDENALTSVRYRRTNQLPTGYDVIAGITPERTYEVLTAAARLCCNCGYAWRWCCTESIFGPA